MHHALQSFLNFILSNKKKITTYKWHWLISSILWKWKRILQLIIMILTLHSLTHAIYRDTSFYEQNWDQTTEAAYNKRITKKKHQQLQKIRWEEQWSDKAYSHKRNAKEILKFFIWFLLYHLCDTLAFISQSPTYVTTS